VADLKVGDRVVVKDGATFDGGFEVPSDQWGKTGTVTATPNNTDDADSLGNNIAVVLDGAGPFGEYVYDASALDALTEP
jgi:hypothetical protein